MNLEKAPAISEKNPHSTARTPMRTLLYYLVISLFFVAGCTPTVKVAPPEKPITINLNVKIQHEIRVKVEKDLDNVLSKDSGLF